MGLFDFMKKSETQQPDSQLDASFSGQQTGLQSQGMPQEQHALHQNPGIPSSGFPSDPFAEQQQFQQQPSQTQFDLQNPFPQGDQEHIPPPIHQETPYPENLPQHSQSSSSDKDMQIILSKLDAIRMAIQNLDHRLTAIEGKLEQSQEIPSYHQQEQNVF
jgi:hypothetical protein